MNSNSYNHRKDYNKAELADEIEHYNVEMVLNAADIDALRRLFEVLGAEEIYRVVEVEGGATPSLQNLESKRTELFCHNQFSTAKQLMSLQQ